MRIHRSLPLLATVLTIALITTPAAAGQPSSEPSGILGTVLRADPMILEPSLAAIATGQRISYLSSNDDGQQIVVTGAILSPRRQQPQRDIVAWAHGTEGLADQCAPSRFATMSSDPAFRLYAATVRSLVAEGWTVAATDYAGLGSPGPHPYLIGSSEGRAIIDSVRAARRVNRSLSNDWVAMGHSQGGQGALFAGEQAREYGQGLQLRGVVGLAAASDLDLLAEGIVGTPGQGYLVMGLSGLAAVDPTVRPATLLAPLAKSRSAVLESGCFMEIIGAYADLTAAELLVDGALPPRIVAKFATNNPGQRPGHAPILLLTGEADETVPTFVADDLLAAYCAKNSTSSVQKYAGATHDSILIDASADALDWINDRFDGHPAPNDCAAAAR